jgi:glycerophosphoryl diester phosphodiesterase
VDYILKFDDGGANTNRGAIDNLSFGQVIPGPDLTPPTIASGNPFNPADDSADVSISANLAVTFNESVVFGTGNITIRESVGNGLVESFDVETSTNLLLSARTVTIAPTNDLSAATGYYVQIDPTAIDDTYGNDFAGIADTSTWNFTTDATPPAIGTVDNPADGTSDVSTDSELALTFSEDVQIGSGNIVIRRISDNGVVAVIDVGGANVTVNGSQVTIVPPSALPELTGLYVEVDAGAFLDLSGNSFAGVSGSETWSFTTAATFRLFIAPNGADFDLSWPSRVGKAYDLLSSTDLATPPAGWAVYDPDGPGGIPAYENIPSDGLLTTLSAVSASGPRRFFVVSEKDAPPVVLVEAHRGYSQVAPENTVASINAAAASADLVEFDVRITSDGELVLMHDGTVNRTTDGSGSTSSLTLAQIQLLDAGSWFSPAFVGEPVPTMIEAINASRAKGMVPLIERKAGAAADYHAEFVSLGLNPSEFRVICFDWNFLAALDSLNPAYRLGALGSGTITQAVIDKVKAKGADFIDWNAGGINQAAVDLVHANGMELHVWTVNGASQMQQLIDYGVDGITTDNPALLRSLLP